MSREQEELDLELELAAAAVELSQLDKIESMPPELRAKLMAGVTAEIRTAPTVRAVPRSGQLVQWSGWIAAAACLIVAVSSWLRAPREVTKVVTLPPEPPAVVKTPTVAEQRQQLRQTAKDLVEVPWSPTKDKAAQGTTGNVVWSTSDQLGYMHFHGLAPNNRAESTYQLWIFDKERDAKYPVDGGTFDVDDANKDIIVPIAAKVRVNKPTLFAITVEKPGGVVVSKRERIVVTAAVN